MKLRVGCEFLYTAAIPTPVVVQVQPRTDGGYRIIEERWDAVPATNTHDYSDVYGNRCRRLVLLQGEASLRYDALVEVADGWDQLGLNQPEVPVDQLPDDTLVYTLPSRYCLSDQLSDEAWDLFGQTERGGARVQAICDWVHNNVRFQYETSTPLTTAVDIFNSRVGVCRDFTHLAITFCRAMNIPTRYVFGYMPDIGLPPPYSPMDFCAWMESYLGGRWYTFDPRNNVPRTGRCVIGRGRDAVDVAMITSYGAPQLRKMTVWADEAGDPASLATVFEAVQDGAPGSARSVER